MHTSGRASSPGPRTAASAARPDRVMERKLTAAAALVALAVALLLPALYFAAGNSSQRAILKTEADMTARLATELVAGRGDGWTQDRPRLEALLARQAGARVPEVRIITTPRGDVVAATGDSLDRPAVAETAEITTGTRAVATLRISRSLRPLLVETAIVGLLGAVLAVLAFLAVKVLPLRALHAAVDRLLEAQQRSDAMEREKKAGEAAAHLKAEFLANMSHEIRTPLNGVFGMTELLLGTRLDAEQRKLAQTAHRSTRALIRILADSLEFSKIEAGKLELQEVAFDLKALVEGVGARLAHDARSNDVSFVRHLASDLPLAVKGDPQRLRQILTHVAGSAIRSTPHGEVTLDVSVEWSSAEIAHVLFTVRDNGAGMDAKALSRMFQPFTRVDEAMSRRYGGTGLALAISKEVAERMGGELSVESIEGRGTVFRCRLPLSIATAPAVERSAQASTAPAAHAIRVLLVEDDEMNQQVAASMLARAGYTVTIADNGAKALQALLGADFDLVLMDVQMPEVDGFSATAAIRGREAADPAARRLPVIALTANAMDGDRQRCLSSGFDDYLAKPFKQHELLCIVERWTQTEPAKLVA